MCIRDSVGPGAGFELDIPASTRAVCNLSIGLDRGPPCSARRLEIRLIETVGEGERRLAGQGESSPFELGAREIVLPETISKLSEQRVGRSDPDRVLDRLRENERLLGGLEPLTRVALGDRALDLVDEARVGGNAVRDRVRRAIRRRLAAHD